MKTVKFVIPSKSSLWQSMAFYLSVINSWAVFSILKEMPSLIMRYNTWNVIGAAAYSLFFALVESIVVFVITNMIAIILQPIFHPKNVKVFSVSLWPTILFTILIFISPDAKLIVGLCACLGLAFLLSRNEKINRIYDGLSNRVVVLGAIYIVIDLISTLIVIFRNIF